MAVTVRRNKKYPLKFVDEIGRIKCLNCGEVKFPHYNKPICRECAQTHSFCLTLQKVLPLSEFYPGHLSESKEATKVRNIKAAKARSTATPKRSGFQSTKDIAKKILMGQIDKK